MAKAKIKKVNVPHDDLFAGYMRQIADLTKMLESLGSGHPLPKILQQWVNDRSTPVTDRMLRSAETQIRQLGREIKAMWKATGETLDTYDYVTDVRNYITSRITYWGNAKMHSSEFTKEAIRFYTDALKILDDAVKLDSNGVNYRIERRYSDVMDFLDVENYQDTDGVYDSSDIAQFELIVTGNETTKEKTVEREKMQGIYEE